MRTMSRGEVLQAIQRPNHELARMLSNCRFPLPIRLNGEEVWNRDEVEEWLRTGRAVKWIARC